MARAPLKIEVGKRYTIRDSSIGLYAKILSKDRCYFYGKVVGGTYNGYRLAWGSNGNLVSTYPAFRADLGDLIQEYVGIHLKAYESYESEVSLLEWEPENTSMQDRGDDTLQEDTFDEPEPECVCDRRQLAVTGCSCSYSRWNQRRMEFLKRKRVK